MRSSPAIHTRKPVCTRFALSPSSASIYIGLTGVLFVVGFNRSKAEGWIQDIERPRRRGGKPALAITTSSGAASGLLSAGTPLSGGSGGGLPTPASAAVAMAGAVLASKRTYNGMGGFVFTRNERRALIDAIMAMAGAVTEPTDSSPITVATSPAASSAASVTSLLASPSAIAATPSSQPPDSKLSAGGSGSGSGSGGAPAPVSARLFYGGANVWLIIRLRAQLQR